MGDTYQTIVDLDADEAEAAAIADRVTSSLIAAGIVVAAEVSDCVLGERDGHRPGTNWRHAVAAPDGRYELFLDLGVNGYCAETGRQFFSCGQDEPHFLCPVGHAIDDDRWTEAVGQWWEFDDSGVRIECGECGRSVALLAAESNCAIANLGFTFWNWPPSSDEFRERIFSMLDGHSSRFIGSKL